MSASAGPRGALDRLLARRDADWDAALRPEPRILAEGLFSIDRRLRLPGGLGMPTRGLAVALPAGGLAVLSPVPLDAGLERWAAAHGPVRALLAPNSFHHLGVGPWSRAFPEAEVWLAPGLAARRPELPPGRELGGPGKAAACFAEVLEPVVYGPDRGLSEVALLHRPSRSLLLWDACFHLCAADGWREAAAWRALGVWRRLAPSRMVRRVLLRDPARVRAFAAALRALEPARIVPAHGVVLEEDVDAALREAFAFAGQPPV